MRLAPCVRRLLAGFITAMASAPAWAGSVVIWPIDPVIPPGQKATALWVENQGLEPMSVQIRAFAWRQADGQESLVDQDALIASPPIATVPPGGRQLIRLMRRSLAAGASEQSYRLLIDELPAPATAQAAKTSAQLAVQMRYSIPLFVYDRPAGPPDLSARLEMQAGRHMLVVRNDGEKHARLVDLRAETAAGAVSVAPGLVGYVLAGQTMRWPLASDAGAASQFRVNVNGAERVLTTP